MRKRKKIKKHSCGLCKPHKLGLDCRWKKRDLILLKEFEKTLTTQTWRRNRQVKFCQVMK